MGDKWGEKTLVYQLKSLHKLSLPTPFPVGPVNVYLLRGDNLVLIDTGPKTEEALNALKSSLKQYEYTLNDIEVVILTHHHSDHAGLLDQFEHAKIFGHERNEPWISFDQSFYKKQRSFIEQLFRQEGVEASLLKKVLEDTGPDRYLTKGSLDGILHEGDEIPGFSEWIAIETPGHAGSHLSFLNESDGTLIAGDTMISHLFPTPLLEAPYGYDEERPKPLLQLRETLLKHLQYDVQLIQSGHGEDLYDIKSVIERQFQKHEQRAQKVERFLQEKGKMTSFEISKYLFPNGYDRSTFLTMSETIGIIDYMLSRGQISAMHRNEIEMEYALIKT